MTFLNPLALIGLLAAAIPIMLHLLNLRKLRTIEFSTLDFLKELQKTRIRRLKLRQLLLLILRTLLVLLVVLAFSRPTLKGAHIGSLGSHAKTSAVFMIDDSYSMTASDDQGTLLRQAKQAANNLVQLFNDGDEVFLLKLSDVGSIAPAIESATRDFGLLRKSIDEMKPSAVRHSLEDGLRVAARMLAGTQNFNKEIYVFSDFQQGVVADEINEAGAGDKLFPPEVRFYIVPAGKRPLQNFGIESLTIPTSIFERDKPFILQAHIGNFSRNNVQDHVVSVFLNGTRVAERSVDLPKGISVPVEFSVAAASIGYVEGFVELEDDDFQFDNRRYFVIHIPERIHVLLVGSAGEIQYPQLALATHTSAAESALLLDRVTPDRLSSVEIKRADVIVLCTTQGFSSAQVSELGAFARSGGGLVVFPSTRIETSAFNAQFAAGLGIPLIAGVDRPSVPRAESESFVEFDKVELQHPLFDGMFEAQDSQLPKRPSSSGTTAGKKVESARIRTSVRYTLGPRSNSIITLTNGAAFLTEQNTGTGRVLLFAVPPTTDWSDLPLKGLFVPLLHRSMLYLAKQDVRAEEALPGAEVVINSNTTGTSSWTIRTPEKVDIAATPTLQAFHQVFRFAGTGQPGFYTVFAKDVPIQKFVVNLDRRESHTGKATSAEMDALFKRVGIDNSSVHNVKQTADLERTVLESRFGVELWKYFLILAFILALVELFVARTSKRETSGTQ